MTRADPTRGAASPPTPRTEAGQSFLRWMADREHWHPIDGRRDVTLGYILAIESEARGAAPLDPFENAKPITNIADLQMPDVTDEEADAFIAAIESLDRPAPLDVPTDAALWEAFEQGRGAGRAEARGAAPLDVDPRARQVDERDGTTPGNWEAWGYFGDELSTTRPAYLVLSMWGDVARAYTAADAELIATAVNEHRARLAEGPIPQQEPE